PSLTSCNDTELTLRVSFRPQPEPTPLLRGREALPAQPENRFSAPSGIGFVDGRLTTRFTGDSNRELNQESP
ncbi:hypothetical protein KMY65_28155, partial [Klebsiella pneumoniae]|uniref:hypothetical protein n=1 Tax=Klebsiella pneumoniae TaxID=573 RepID=UPI00200517E9